MEKKRSKRVANPEKTLNLRKNTALCVPVILLYLNQNHIKNGHFTH